MNVVCFVRLLTNTRMGEQKHRLKIITDYKPSHPFQAHTSVSCKESIKSVTGLKKIASIVFYFTANIVTNHKAVLYHRRDNGLPKITISRTFTPQENGTKISLVKYEKKGSFLCAVN